MSSAAHRLEHPREVWTSEEGSMARETAVTRWPKIVQSMVDDVGETLGQSECMERQQIDEGRRIQQALRILKEEIIQDQPLRPLSSDGRTDIESFNTKLASFGHAITWHNCPWLFAECHLYRCVQTFFSRSESTFWQNYDVFARQKLNAFLASHSAVKELCERYLSIADSGACFATTADEETQRLLFFEMTEVALWGNATDLSLLSSLSLDQIHSLQGKKAIQEGQARIVSNDMAAAWEHLRRLRPGGGRVDIVLDNAGFELFTDLIYALYLLGAGLASAIRLHVKSIPWFVSDVMPHDMDILLSALTDTASFPSANNESVRTVAALLSAAYQDGRLAIQENPFWTTGLDFQEMPVWAPDLFEALQESALVIFKGDLNYRKLVRDATWPHTTPFKQAIGVLGGGSSGDKAGIKILALRTNKADVCVGLNERTLEKVEKEAPRKAWVRNGKYAVVSFSEGL
ncbi:DUF89 domain protein [Echria macrotheca]|uniref:Sugar phosphate phosphatase n=1 Tax=Echria macrotheca TaxID=438768 RepID=A0AAJ0BEZ5_9PEZI|nr:DUF89 domain protein [Echria macrotheca]